jgi:hypothetical protein
MTAGVTASTLAVMAKPGPKRQRGTIRQRGGSFQVVVYAGQAYAGTEVHPFRPAAPRLRTVRHPLRDTKLDTLAG